jgi:hypothetical protein
MPDYKQGKIYKIVCNVTGSVYIGSTIQSLSMRLAGHRKDYKSFKEGKSTYVTSYQIIEQGNYDIVLIENCPCESKDELHRRERHFIESLKCVNKQLPTRTKKEYRLDNKDAIKENSNRYRQNNKDAIKERTHQYQLDNRDMLIEKSKQYYQANKDDMNEKRKLRRLKKKSETSP